jgi:hypothetical protein
LEAASAEDVERVCRGAGLDGTRVVTAVEELP